MSSSNNEEFLLFDTTDIRFQNAMIYTTLKNITYCEEML